jgi:tRNA-splicing ligase RtcB (3'-phosphate/5'-hydroxy nucleic acid ligase)
MDALAARVPKGAGRGGVWKHASRSELDQPLTGGARFAVTQGFGVERPGPMRGPGRAGRRRCRSGERPGRGPGTRAGRQPRLGHHFLELQVVEEIRDPGAAAAFGLVPGRVCVMIHCGSRGVGNQICSDHVRRMQSAMARYDISVPDRQLACAPVRSPEGEAYPGGDGGCRQLRSGQPPAPDRRRTGGVRPGFGRHARSRLRRVSHNRTKLEWHDVDGARRPVCVHRKGATRALPPGHPKLPEDLGVRRFNRTSSPALWVPPHTCSSGWRPAAPSHRPATARVGG